MFLHISLVDEAPIATTGTLGIDLGVVNLATDSDGESFRGDDVEACRNHYGRRRKVLQKVGTKSAKRKLRKTRSQERRFRNSTKISKAIVAKAKGTALAIGVEDLAGIGERTTVNKAQRNRMKGWAFYQLRTFIAYKAVSPKASRSSRSISRTPAKRARDAGAVEAESEEPERVRMPSLRAGPLCRREHGAKHSRLGRSHAAYGGSR